MKITFPHKHDAPHSSVLATELRAFCTPGKGPTTKPKPQPQDYILLRNGHMTPAVTLYVAAGK